MPAPSEVTEPASLWRNRDFNLLWGSQALSTIGGQSALIAYSLLVLTLTHSPGWAGTVGTCRLIAGYIGGFAGGVLVDRYDRRWVIVISDTVRCLAMLGLGVLVLEHYATVAVVVAVAALDGTFATPVNAALDAAVVKVVPDAQLERAVAQDQARQQGAFLAGPPLGGALFGLSAYLPFLANAASYLMSVIGVARVHTSLAVERDHTQDETLWRQLTGGFTWLLERPPIAALCGSLALINLTGVTVDLLVIVLARRSGATSLDTGTALAIGGLGGLIGAVIAPTLIEKLGRLGSVLLAVWAATVLVAALSIAPGFIGLGVTLGLVGLLVPAANVVVVGNLLRLVPDSSRGRVTSALSLTITGLSALGPIAAGTLLTSLGSAAAIACASPALGAAILLTSSTQVRHAITGTKDRGAGTEAAPL